MAYLKRGSENIDFDTYKNNLYLNLPNYLSKFKPKELREVRAAIDEMVAGMASGDFTYKLGGGYDNTKGIVNASKGFDKYGYAAGYLGSLFRKEAAKKNNNASVSDRSGLGTYIKKKLGGDNFTEELYKGLDYKDRTSNKNRVAALRTVLDDIRNQKQDNSIFTEYSDVETWNRDYDNIKHVFDDDIITQDEYLSLAKLTGIDDLPDLLSTSNEEDDDLPVKKAFIVSDHPAYSLELEPFVHYILAVLDGDSTNALKSRLVHVVRGFDLTKFTEFTDGKRLNEFPINNNYMAKLILDKLVDRGEIRETGLSNIYSIPGLSYILYDDNTGEIKDSGQYLKEGGVIRKFNSGNKILTFNPLRNNMYFTGDFNTEYDNWHATNIVNPWLKSYKDADKTDWEILIKRGLDSWNNAGGFEWYNATDELRKHGMQSAGTKAHQLYVIDYLPGLNVENSKYFSMYGVPDKANTADRFENGVATGTDTDFGILTGNRRPSIHIKTSGQTLTDWENYYKNLGYVGKYKYLDHWVPTKNKNQEGILLFDGKSSDEVKNPNATVYETGLPKPKSVDTSWVFKSSPEFISALRLFKSLYTNNKIHDILKNSIHPNLHNTYELYSPITGNFAQRLFLRLQGNNVLFNSNLPFTTDANLSAGRMLEGWRLANELYTKGDLIDNSEIKTKLQDALARVENNIKLRTELSNENFDKLTDYDERIGQLSAIKLRSNYNSLDNYFKGIESRLRLKLQTTEDEFNNFLDKVDYLQVKKLYDDYDNKLNEELNNWYNSPDGRDENGDLKDPSLYPGYNEMIRLKIEAKYRMQDMLYLKAALRYKIPYTSIYNDNDLFFNL